MSGFSRDWLRLREKADLAARDPGLARRFAASLSRVPGQAVRLLDLGAGTGANCRALMPRIPGDQDWLLIERDRDLIAAQAEEMTLWARRQGYPILAGGGQMTITAGAATWHVTSRALDLAQDLASLDRLDADGVTAAALFDLVSASWTERFAALLTHRALPLLAVLTVDGKRAWQPALAEDEVVAADFRRHQGIDKGFGPALGPNASRVLAQSLAAQGCAVVEAVSDWRLDARDGTLLAELVAGEARAARAAEPRKATAVAEWETRRRDQLKNGSLTLTIGHRDLLALPGGSGNMAV
jgi:hypothetical protein